MNIGFVGLGKMGTGMARNLLRAGHTLKVYNRSREKAAALEQDGAHVVDTPAETARGSEAVFTMLADDRAVESAVWSQDGVAAGLEKNGVHISSSTISAAYSEKLAGEHKKQGQHYIAAPVFGRPEAAEGKKLIVVVGGDNELLTRFDPLFSAIGRRTFRAGSNPSQANVIKLCGNFMIASMLESFSEALTAVAKSGGERQAFYDVMSELFGSPVYQNYGKSLVERKFDASSGFALKLGLKDIRQVLELTQDVASPMPIASLIRDHLLAAIAHGQEDLDWSSIELVLERNAGLQ